MSPSNDFRLQTPFYHSDRAELYKRVLHGQVPFSHRIDPAIKSFILMLLNRNPELRRGSKEIRAHAFFASIDWSQAINRQLVPPFVPELVRASALIGEA